MVYRSYDQSKLLNMIVCSQENLVGSPWRKKISVRDCGHDNKVLCINDKWLFYLNMPKSNEKVINLHSEVAETDAIETNNN